MHIFEKYEDKKNVVLNLKGIENFKKVKISYIFDKTLAFYYL